MSRKSNKNIEIPKGKLIGQNGPGSLYVDTEGISYVISAADKWYSTNRNINIEKFIIHEPRLEKALKVRNFREVPSYINPKNSDNKENTGICIPLQRFPLNHYCTKCGYIKEFFETHGPKNSYCQHCDKSMVFTQLPLVIVCEKGHLSDFPYFNFVHSRTRYDKELKHGVRVLRQGNSILNWTIKCDCGAAHSLAGVTGHSKGDDLTPFQKEMGGREKCGGRRPWTGEKEYEECDSKPSAILRNSINSYNAETISALTISIDESGGEFSYEQILSDEFKKLSLKKVEENKEKLEVEKSFKSENSIIKNVNFVFRLEELVVQTGFHRLSISDEEKNWNKATSIQSSNMLFSSEVKLPSWYPAKKQYGEGIFIEFNKEVLNLWSQKTEVETLHSKLMERVESFYLADRFLSPIDIMIHTLSHSLIHQLSLKSGYPVTSIREKLYLNKDEYGLLLYVTDSDKDGTFGGLVRLAEEKKFKLNINEALKRLDWCSSDPVCFELGRDLGQGYHNSNGAACHNCTFIPDTACSYRNCFLNRDYIGRTESDICITNYFSIYLD